MQGRDRYNPNQALLMILLTRKAEFSSSHYYWSEQLSAEATGVTLGKASRPVAVTSAEVPTPTQRPVDRALPARGLRMR